MKQKKNKFVDTVCEVGKDVVAGAVSNVTGNVLIGAVEDAAAAKEIENEYMERIGEEKRKILKAYWEQFTDLFRLCEEDAEANGKDMGAEPYQLTLDDEFLDAWDDTKHYYQQHRADLDVGKLGQYHEQIDSFVARYIQGRKSASSELFRLIEDARMEMVKALQ